MYGLSNMVNMVPVGLVFFKWFGSEVGSQKSALPFQ